MMLSRMMMRGYRPGQSYAQSANMVCMMILFILTFLPYCLIMFIWGMVKLASWPIRAGAREIGSNRAAEVPSVIALPGDSQARLDRMRALQAIQNGRRN